MGGYSVSFPSIFYSNINGAAKVTIYFANGTNTSYEINALSAIENTTVQGVVAVEFEILSDHYFKQVYFSLSDPFNCLGYSQWHKENEPIEYNGIINNRYLGDTTRNDWFHIYIDQNISITTLQFSVTNETSG